MRDIVVGTFTGAGADVNVSIGFVPTAVIVFATETEGFAIHRVGLSQSYVAGTVDESAMAAVAGKGVSQAEGNTVDASGAVSAYLGDDTHAPGFTIANAAIGNDNGQTCNYIAFRADAIPTLVNKP
jgi:hypothetical protein